MRRFLLAVGCAVAVAGCGSTASAPTGGGTTAATQSSSGGSPATPAPSTGALGNLVVSGSLSLTLAETSNTSNKCQPGSGNTISAILVFDAYALQFSLPIGTTQFPQGAGLVAFFNGNDSTQEWSIGSRVSAGQSGTATISADGKTGSVDVAMLPDPPRPNPALKPIHVKGSFTCQ